MAKITNNHAMHNDYIYFICFFIPYSKKTHKKQLTIPISLTNHFLSHIKGLIDLNSPQWGRICRPWSVPSRAQGHCQSESGSDQRHTCPSRCGALRTARAISCRGRTHRNDLKDPTKWVMHPMERKINKNAVALSSINKD